jgi:hypothetical protein
MVPFIVVLFSAIYVLTIVMALFVGIIRGVEEFVEFVVEHNSKTNSLFPLVISCWSNK